MTHIGERLRYDSYHAMAYRRKYGRKPAFTRRRKPFVRSKRSRKTYLRAKARVASRVHMFTRTTLPVSYNLTDAFSNNMYGRADRHSFHLLDLPNYSEFTSLFDSYKINRIVADISFNPPGNDVSTASDTVWANQCDVQWAIDLDGGPGHGLLTETELLEMGTRLHKRVLNNGRHIRLSLTPRMNARATDTSAAPFQFMIPKRTWIDCTDPQAQYEGLVTLIKCRYNDAVTPVFPNFPSYTIQFTYYFQCKDPR